MLPSRDVFILKPTARERQKDSVHSDNEGPQPGCHPLLCGTRMSMLPRRIGKCVSLTGDLHLIAPQIMSPRNIVRNTFIMRVSDSSSGSGEVLGICCVLTVLGLQSVRRQAAPSASVVEKGRDALSFEVYVQQQCWPHTDCPQAPLPECPGVDQGTHSHCLQALL